MSQEMGTSVDANSSHMALILKAKTEAQADYTVCLDVLIMLGLCRMVGGAAQPCHHHHSRYTAANGCHIHTGTAVRQALLLVSVVIAGQSY